MDAMEVKVEGGILRATKSTDSEYPGIDVEFIADNDNGENISRPRVLFEKPKGENLRVLIWNDKNSEDYTENIDFK